MDLIRKAQQTYGKLFFNILKIAPQILGFELKFLCADMFRVAKNNLMSSQHVNKVRNDFDALPRTLKIGDKVLLQIQAVSLESPQKSTDSCILERLRR